eukprot:5735462-Amphidinium_carterae.1
MPHMRETRTHIDNLLLQDKRQKRTRTKQRPSTTTRKSTGYGKQCNKGGKKGQVPIHQINDNDYPYYYNEDPHSWDYSYNQEWFPEGDYSQQFPGQKVDQQEQVFQQQPSRYLTIGSLYEIVAIIHIGRQPPRHLKDFWSIIIDTGAAVSVCPMLTTTM